ncbi:MAG: hypothetical protein E6G62_10220, partial [Actinobacteria bacterium]
MLALEALNGGETLFEQIERRGAARRGFGRGAPAVELVDLRSAAVVAQLGGEVLRLQHERLQALGERVQSWVEPRERLQPPDGAGERLRGPRRLVGVRRERVGAGGGGGAQRVEAAQALTQREQLLVLALVGSCRIDLGELVLEQVELPVAGARELAQAVELRLQARRLGECGCARAQAFSLLRPADAVEDL